MPQKTTKHTHPRRTLTLAEMRQRLPFHLLEKARREHLCLGCLDPTHQIKECPYVGARISTAPRNPNGDGANQPRGNGGNERQNNFNNQNPNFNQNQANEGNAQNANHQKPPRPPQAQPNQRANVNLNPSNQPQRAQVHVMDGIPHMRMRKLPTSMWPLNIKGQIANIWSYKSRRNMKVQPFIF